MAFIYFFQSIGGDLDVFPQSQSNHELTLVLAIGSMLRKASGKRDLQRGSEQHSLETESYQANTKALPK